jgi:hypothetical protein
MADEIKLGSTVRDKVTGLQGYACQLREDLFGARQYGIQPMGDGKSMPDPYFVDIQTVEFVDVGLSDLSSPVPENVAIKLGDKVRDITTGEKGIATAKIAFLNGCVFLTVTVKAKGKNKGYRFFTDHKALEVVAPDLLRNVSTSSSGGPSTRAFRQEDC